MSLGSARLGSSGRNWLAASNRFSCQLIGSLLRPLMLAAFASAFAFRDEPQSERARNQRMMMMRKRTFLLLRPAPRQLPRRPPRMHRLDTQTRPEPNRAARCQPKADTSAVVVHNCAELASCLLGNSIESRAASSDSGASKAATIVRVVPRPRQPSEVSGRPSECRIVCLCAESESEKEEEASSERRSLFPLWPLKIEANRRGAFPPRLWRFGGEFIA